MRDRRGSSDEALAARERSGRKPFLLSTDVDSSRFPALRQACTGRRRLSAHVGGDRRPEQKHILLMSEPDEVFKRALDAELRRRLDVLGEDGDNAALGRFDGRDWALIGMVLVLLPLAAVWMFA